MLPENNNRRGRPPGQTALTAAERQAKLREKRREAEHTRWWEAEQECRAAEAAVELAEQTSEAAWGPVNEIAEKIAAELQAITDAIDQAVADGQMDAHMLASRRFHIDELFTEHKAALANKREAVEAYRIAVNRRQAAWQARETIERQQDQRRRRSTRE